MKVIIAGSRSITDYAMLEEAIKDSSFKITEIISGGCKAGIDTLGERYAKENNIPLKIFPAEWIRYGVAAGPIRNKEMAKNADALLAVWDGKSKGTSNMVDEANNHGLKIYLYRTDMKRLG